MFLISKSSVLPVSLDLAKDHLGINGTDWDTWLTQQLKAAKREIEEETGKRIGTETWQEHFCRFPYTQYETMRLNLTPVSSITSIQYIQDDSFVTWSSTNYELYQPYNSAAYIRAKTTWPSNFAIYTRPDNVKITYVVGDDNNIDERVVAAALDLVSQWWTYRGENEANNREARNGYQRIISGLRNWDA